MALIGCLGDVAFTVSDSVVETLDNMKWSGSARYAVHQRHLANALTEFVGLDPDKISFDMTLSVDLGVDPMAEVVKLWNYERSGQAVPLTIGAHGYGKYRWSVISHEMKVTVFNRAGDLSVATVSVNLQEYLGG